MTRRLSLIATTLILPLLLAAAFMFVTDIQAADFTVCAVTCDYSSIQEAVNDDITVNNTLILSAGIFAENVEITRSISLVGQGPGLTIIDGQMTDTVILVSDGAAVSISGVTIQNGDTTAVDGGGLLVESSTVTLTNSVVENNHAPSGAGITNDGTMIIDNVTVRNNVADELVGEISVCTGCAGGGIYNLSVMTVTNSFIYNNMAQFGGGIDNANSASLSATNIEVYGNQVANNPADPDAAGGGIENLGTMTLTNSIVRNNTAENGAGIANASQLTVTGSDVYANVASGQGGGLYNSFNLTVQTSNIYDNEAGSAGGGGISSEGGTVVVEQTAVYNNSATSSAGGIVQNVTAGVNSFTITNSTVSGNSTSGAGGGIRNEGMANPEMILNNVTLHNNQAVVANGQSIYVVAGSVTAKNSIIATNQSEANCSGTIISQGYNIADDSSCSLSSTADLANSNPQLGPLQNNGGNTLTHALLAGSPAINSGNNCPAVDQRGVARTFGPACDRGAYEFDQDLMSVYLPFVIRP